MTRSGRSRGHSTRAWLVAVAIAISTIAMPRAARAEADSFGIGSGRTGDVTINAPATINAYARCTGIDSNRTTLSVDTSAGFSPGDLALVIQMASFPTSTSGSQSAVNMTFASTGQWELARVLSTTASSITVTSSLVNIYVVSTTQVVRVPEYRNLTVNAQVSAASWDGQKGGVLAFLATGTVTINSGGSLNADGRGFRGGPSIANANANCGNSADGAPSSGFAHKGEGIYFINGFSTNPALGGVGGRGNHLNAGGGGNCDGAGGGGGGNGGAGGNGGHANDQQNANKGGYGGAALTYSLLTRMTFGGGGGAGHTTTAQQAGGAGGGLIFFRANALTVNSGGLITARGATPANPNPVSNGMSGGGAGGSVVIRLAGAATCTPNPAINVSGGNGATNPTAVRYGPGGGGGGGRVLLQATSSSCNATVAAGTNGVPIRHWLALVQLDPFLRPHRLSVSSQTPLTHARAPFVVEQTPIALGTI